MSSGQLSGKNLPGVPSRESNLGPVLLQADALPTELRRTSYYVSNNLFGSLLGLSKENPIHTLPLQSLPLQTLRLVFLFSLIIIAYPINSI